MVPGAKPGTLVVSQVPVVAWAASAAGRRTRMRTAARRSIAAMRSMALAIVRANVLTALRRTIRAACFVSEDAIFEVLRGAPTGADRLEQMF
jgi:hypothetical protein